MRRRSEAGYSLVALLALLTITLIMMAAALPSWRYLVKDDREQELIFRGTQIVNAVKCYQEKTKTAPTSLEAMVKQHCLRKAYKDPMTTDGKWRFHHQGEGLPGAGGLPGGKRGLNTKTGDEPTDIGEVPGTTPPTTEPSSRLGAPAGTTFGAIDGVVSTSKERSLRVFNGKTRYSEWVFAGDPDQWTIGSQKPAGPNIPKPNPLNSPSANPIPTPLRSPPPEPQADQQ